MARSGVKRARDPVEKALSDTDDEQWQPPLSQRGLASPDGMTSPALLRTQRSSKNTINNELTSYLADGAMGLATGVQASAKMGQLPSIHQLIFPMAQGTRVIVFKLVDHHLARRRGCVLQLQCPLCQALIHQRLAEVEKGKELPAARAHLQRTIGNQHQSFHPATAGKSITQNENSCRSTYNKWCRRISLLQEQDPLSHDDQRRYIKGREVCVPLYSDAFQWGYESWRNVADPLDISSCLSVPRSQKAKEAGLPTTPVKAETSTAGMATQICSPASPTTPKWELKSDATSSSSPPPVAPDGNHLTDRELRDALSEMQSKGVRLLVDNPNLQKASRSQLLTLFVYGNAPNMAVHKAPPAPPVASVSSPAKPNYRDMHLSPTKLQHNLEWQNCSPTPFCSCAQTRYKGDGVFPVVKVHDVDCECNIDLNEGWPVQMHWELHTRPKRIQPK